MHKNMCTFSMRKMQYFACENCKSLLRYGRGRRQGLICEREIMQENKETYELFVNEVTEALRVIAGTEYTVIPRKERRNNSVILDGLLLQKENERVAPNVYLNHYYADYRNGKCAEKIAEEILALCREKREEILALTEKLDFSSEYVSKHLYYRLIGQESNEELLKEIPHRTYLNLAVVYYWVVYEEGEQIGSIMMTKRQMERFGWKEEQLLELAQENTPRLFPMMTKGMDEIVGELLAHQDELQMLVLSNEKGINGAACLMYPGVLQRLEEAMKGSFYVLPSSIHELIVLPDNGASAVHLCEMVYCINRTHLPQEDVLSDTVYYYSKETGELSVVDAMGEAAEEKGA